MTYTYEDILAADIPAYVTGAAQFAAQAGAVGTVAGLASDGYRLLGGSFSGQARAAQLGDATSVASATGALTQSSTKLLDQMSETPTALAIAKAKVLAVQAAVETSPMGPMMIGAGGVITLLPRADDEYDGEARAAACAAFNAKMRAAIALANGEDVKGKVQTVALGVSLASALKAALTTPHDVTGTDGDQWSAPPALDLGPGPELPVEQPATATDASGPYQGLTGYTPPPVSGVSGLSTAAGTVSGAPAAGAVGAGAVGGGTSGGGLLRVPGGHGPERDDDEGPEIRQWSIAEETDEFWRAADDSATNGVLT